MVNKRKNATWEDVIKALEVLAKYHEQRGLSYIVINTQSGIVARGGNSLELEALVNQTKLYLEGLNNINFVNIHTAREAAQQAAKQEAEEKQGSEEQNE